MRGGIPYIEVKSNLLWLPIKNWFKWRGKSATLPFSNLDSRTVLQLQKVEPDQICNWPNFYWQDVSENSIKLEQTKLILPGIYAIGNKTCFGTRFMNWNILGQNLGFWPFSLTMETWKPTVVFGENVAATCGMCLFAFRSVLSIQERWIWGTNSSVTKSIKSNDKFDKCD